ncbi:MAG TPA: sulfite exporter TauE/SafE family protein [Candidatus Humimicrobiaceae bacterium]
MIFQVVLSIVAIIAGGIASIAGFGIGSFVTPLLAFKTGIGVAVAGISIAHFSGTALRFFVLRRHINKKILLSFGLTSAAGGLVGALFHNVFYNIVLIIIFSCLLIFAGIMELTGLSEKIRFSGAASWAAGAMSGFFGGLVGNQGGIRSAAMLSYELKKKEFVATATGIALMVDVARIPVYIITQGEEMLSIWKWILIASIGVLVGTAAGTYLLRKIPEKIFKKGVASIIILVGIFILIYNFF